MSKIGTILIFAVLFAVGCSINENQFSKGVSSSTRDILNKCKCTEQCYGEKIYDYCLINEAETPNNCKDFLGIYLGKSYDGSVEYYFDDTKLKACYETLLNKQSTVNYCDDFPENYSYKCYYNVGTLVLNPKICSDLPYTYKQSCYLKIAKNDSKFKLTFCDELQNQDKLECYSVVANNHNDSKICLKLETNSDKVKCYSRRSPQNLGRPFKSSVDFSYYPTHLWWINDDANFDKSLINEEYCNIIGGNISSGKNVDCYIAIAVYNNNIGLCSKLPRTTDAFSPRGKCFFNVGLWGNFELEDCDKFGIDFKECRDGVALSKRNPELCKKVYSTEKEKSDCIYKIATDYYGSYNNKNILFCKDASNKVDCINRIYKEEDEQFLQKEICELLSTSNDLLTLSAKCYYNFAIKNLDLSSCDKIDDGYSSMKSDCRERVQHAFKS